MINDNLPEKKKNCYEFAENTLRKLLKRDKNAHKGSCGRVCVIAGSRNMTGAPVLCGMGALRSGCGLLYLVVPKAVLPVCQSCLIEAVYKTAGRRKKEYFTKSDVRNIIDFAVSCDSAVIGPGLGRNKRTVAFAEKFLIAFVKAQKSLKEAGKKVPKLIIDADGLYALAKMREEKKKVFRANSLPEYVGVTPHLGEASMLLNRDLKDCADDKMSIAEEISEKYSVSALVKGCETCICDGKKKYVNYTGNCGMATAGSGDVLAGVTGTFAAGTNVFEAMAAASFVHGLSGDFCRDKFGISFMNSEDIAGSLYSALKKYEE